MTSRTNEDGPILSICIPTLNRASLLEDQLFSLKGEVASLGGDVEVVVSDNCSSDDTPGVLERHSDWVRSIRSDRTTGFCANIMRVTCDLARGRFVWLVGDDDLVIRGAVTRVVESLKAHPDVAYHYLNFGWLEVKRRHELIRKKDSKLWWRLRPKDFQVAQFDTLLLPRVEDLAFLPGSNPSALFSGIFCFAAHREVFLAGRDRLNPSDSLDGSSTLMDDCFPHAVVTLPPSAGKPAVFIGEPCSMQGISGWEWGDYAYKNMIFGTHQFFNWLENETPFADDAMRHLWDSYYTMAGRLFFRMLYFPEEHKGLDLVLERAIPGSAAHMTFWDAYMEESKLNLDTDHDARNLSEWVKRLLLENPDARVGLWGVYGRGHRFVKLSPRSRRNLVWVTDKQESLHGARLDGTRLKITPPETLADADLDIFVIGARRKFIPEITEFAAPLLKPGAVIVSVDGISANPFSGRPNA